MWPLPHNAFELVLVLLLSSWPRLRYALESDEQALHKLTKTSMHPEQYADRKWWRAQLREQGAHWLVLERAGDRELVGVVGHVTRGEMYGLPIRGHVPLLAVHPSCRRRGYGQFLLRSALLQLHASFDCVSLYVRPDNDAALRLYRRCGFEQHVVVPGYYADGANAILCVRWRALGRSSNAITEDESELSRKRISRTVRELVYDSADTV